MEKIIDSLHEPEVKPEEMLINMENLGSGKGKRDDTFAEVEELPAEASADESGFEELGVEPRLLRSLGVRL